MDNTFHKSRLNEFLTPAVGSNPRWVLCYRASTHGWAVSTFHSRCDGKRNTVTIIKNGEYVFGGYTDIPWGKYNNPCLRFLFLFISLDCIGVAIFISSIPIC